MNEQECSRSVPIRNVPLHRKDFGGLGEQSEDLHVWWIQIHYEVYWGGVRVCVCVSGSTSKWMFQWCCSTGRGALGRVF